MLLFIYQCEGSSFLTLRMQELPMTISIVIMIMTLKVMVLKTATVKNNLKDNRPWFFWQRQVKRSFFFYHFLLKVLFFHRGICYFFVEVTCASKDLHSGVFGGTV